LKLRLSLLLMLLDLRSLLILLLPLLSEFLSLCLGARVIVLDAPRALPFPMALLLPALPVLLQALGRNPLIVPRVPVPIMGSVVASPAGVDIIIEPWDPVVISPTPVVIPGAVPPPFPGTPPPPIPEEQVDLYIRNDVHTARLRHHDHRRRCLKDDGGWQRDIHANTYGCPRWKRDDHDQRQQHYSQG